MIQCRRQSGFDIVKALACVAVVLIHYNFKGDVGGVVKSLCRFAVPVFFMISGFFLTSFEMEMIDPGEIVRKQRKLVGLLFWSTVFYGIVAYLDSWFTAGCTWPMFGSFCQKHLPAPKIALFVVCNAGLFNLALWFIGALIACYAVVCLWIPTTRRLRRCWLLIIPLVIVMSVSQEFASIVGFKWNFIPVMGTEEKTCYQLSALFVFRALPFFLIGTWFRAHRNVIAGLSVGGWVWWCIFAIGLLLSYCEYVWIDKRAVQFFLGSYVCAMALMAWGLRVGAVGRLSRAIAWIGRELSLDVYILHIAVGLFVSRLAGCWHLSGKTWYGGTLGLIVVALSLLTALGAYGFRRFAMRIGVPSLGKVVLATTFAALMVVSICHDDASVEIRFHRQQSEGEELRVQKVPVGSSTKLFWKGSQLHWTDPQGQTFLGWAISPASRTAVYVNGQDLTDVCTAHGSIDLYPVWFSKTKDGKVRYYRNMSRTDDAMAIQVVSPAVPVQLAWLQGWLGWSVPSKRFLGWAETPRGPVKYPNGAVVPLTIDKGKSVELFGIWSSE